MYQALLDHWWIANVVPYFAFNYWLVYAFERDEGRFDHQDAAMKWAMYAIGLVAVIAIVIWAVAGLLHEQLVRLELGAWHRRLDWQRRLTSASWWLVRGVLELLGLVLVYLIVITVTGYHPFYWECFIEILALWLIGHFALSLRKGR